MYIRLNDGGGLTPEEASRLYHQQQSGSRKVTPQGAKTPKKTKKVKPPKSKNPQQQKANKKVSKTPIFAPHADTHTPTENDYPKPTYSW